MSKPLKTFPQISRISSSPKLCVSPSNLLMTTPGSPFSPFCPVIDSPLNIFQVTETDYHGLFKSIQQRAMQRLLKSSFTINPLSPRSPRSPFSPMMLCPFFVNRMIESNN